MNYSQLPEEMVVEAWITKRKRPVFLLLQDVVFFNKQGDSSWHFNSGASNVTQSIENSCFIWQWPTHCKTLRTSSLQWKKFIWRLCPQLHDFPSLGGKQAWQERSIFRQGCFRSVKIGQVSSTFIKATEYSSHRAKETCQAKACWICVFLQAYHQIWSITWVVNLWELYQLVQWGVSYAPTLQKGCISSLLHSL